MGSSRERIRDECTTASLGPCCDAYAENVTGESSGADDRDELPVHLMLPGGVELVVRAVEADDVAAITALYQRLSPESVYRRFFTMALPPASFFERLTTVVERGGLGLVAEVVTAPEPDVLGVVGEVEVEPLANGNGEIAIIVDGRWRGWLGSYLVELACGAAHRLGMPNLEAEVLACNRPMRAVTRHRGEAFLPSSDWKEVRVLFSTAEPAPSWLPRDRPRVLVEQQHGVAFDAVSGLAAAGYEVVACAGRTAGRPFCPLLTGDPCSLAERADAIIVAMPASPERNSLVVAHQSRAIPVIVVEPGSVRLTGDALVVAAESVLKTETRMRAVSSVPAEPDTHKRSGKTSRPKRRRQESDQTMAQSEKRRT